MEAVAGAPVAPAEAKPAAELPRSTWSLVDAPPLSNGALCTDAHSVFLLTDDERGSAERLADVLRMEGATTVVVRHDGRVDAFECVDSGLYLADLGNAETVEKLVAAVRAVCRRKVPVVR